MVPKSLSKPVCTGAQGYVINRQNERVLLADDGAYESAPGENPAQQRRDTAANAVLSTRPLIREGERTNIPGLSFGPCWGRQSIEVIPFGATETPACVGCGCVSLIKIAGEYCRQKPCNGQSKWVRCQIILRRRQAAMLAARRRRFSWLRSSVG